MTSKTVMLICVALLAVALVFAFTDTAAAQADDQVTGDTANLKSTDNDLSQKRTVNDSLANRKLGGEEAEEGGPTRLQMGIGLGSCVVMIAVVKWL